MKTRWAGAAFVALALTSIPATSEAIVLAAGAGPVNSELGVFDSDPTATPFNVPVGTPFTFQLGITGTYGQATYTSNVFNATIDTFDYYYRFTISTGTVTSAGAANFSIGPDISADVSYLDTAAMNAAFAATDPDGAGPLTGNAIFSPVANMQAPNQFSRTPDGTGINFFYTVPDELITGETTFVLKVRTDAPLTIAGGQIAVQAGGAAAIGNVFQPFGTPVPEPTGALFGLAALGAVLGRRRSRAQAALAA